MRDGIFPITPARRCAQFLLSLVDRAGPVLVVSLTLVALWLVAVPIANGARVSEEAARAGQDPTVLALIERSMWLGRPVLPSPQQLLAELWSSTTSDPLNSRRNLLFHVWATLSSALLGITLGVLVGAVLAVLVVEFKRFDAATMPWIVASQTVPTLAFAPIVVVLLGRLGIADTLQRAVIGAVIVFFPVTLGLIKGLRSVDPTLRDLMKTYAAPRWWLLVSIRLPSALPFLFPALKVASAVAIVATIVAELPTGSSSGLGARLLVGSYNGMVLVMWSALIAAAILAGSLVGIVTLLERVVIRRLGGRRP